jgi:hypothetical protein
MLDASHAVEAVGVFQHRGVAAGLDVKQDLRHGGLDRIVGRGLEGQQRMQLLLEAVVGGVEFADLYCHGSFSLVFLRPVRRLQ